MADNYTFKDAGKSLQTRAAKEIGQGIYYNRDIEVLDSGVSAKTCDRAIATVQDPGAGEIEILPANPNRKGVIIQAYSGSEGSVGIMYGAPGATGGIPTVIIPFNGLWEMPYPIYLKEVSSFNLTAAQFVRLFITELM